MAGWILTTPASRGIGFSLTRLLLQKTSLPIVATARRDLEGTKARLLDGLDGVEKSRLSVLEVDVTSNEHSLFFASPPPTLRLLPRLDIKNGPQSTKRCDWYYRGRKHCSSSSAMQRAIWRWE